MYLQSFETSTGFKRIFSNAAGSFRLRMAPMIDMIFLLLLFFFVTARWKPQENFLPFQLPMALGEETMQPVRPEPLLIRISATQSGCSVMSGQSLAVEITSANTEADLIILMEKMRDVLVAQKRFAGDPVEIICDGGVKWNYLAKIYNLFYGAGVTDITFVMTEQTEN